MLNPIVFEVILQRESDYLEGSVGIILTGSAESGKIEIIIHRVTTGSLADEDGRVRKGDRLLAIQGKLTNQLTTAEARAVMKARASQVHMVLARKTSSLIGSLKIGAEGLLGKKSKISKTMDSNGANCRPASTNTTLSESCYTYSSTPCDVQMKNNGVTGLGLSLDGGKHSSNGDRPFTIKRIFTGGEADKSGQLKIGDQVLAINGQQLTEMTHMEAWKLLKLTPEGPVTLTVLLRK